MSREEVMQAIIRCAREVLPALEHYEFRSDDSLRDLGANSIDRSEIVMMTLESLVLNMPLVEVARAQNIGELASIMHEKLQGAAQPLLHA